jgi:hypothetical protein
VAFNNEAVSKLKTIRSPTLAPAEFMALTSIFWPPPVVWHDALAVHPLHALLRTVFTQAVSGPVRRTIPCSVANSYSANELLLLIKKMDRLIQAEISG